MNKALLITAFDRLRYFQETLHFWHDVRQLDDWHVMISIDPSRWTQHMVEEAEEFVHHRGLTDYEIVVQPENRGVLLHPYLMMERLFASGYDFVVRAEDDLLVSDDILEMFEYAAFSFENRDEVATVQAWSDTDGPSNVMEHNGRFNPLVWGTWASRWFEFIGPTWDKDYSTNNGTYMTEAGWDWNLQREFGRRGRCAMSPVASRVQNIGEFGTHSNPANFVVSPSFTAHRPWHKWECR